MSSQGEVVGIEHDGLEASEPRRRDADGRGHGSERDREIGLDRDALETDAPEIDARQRDTEARERLGERLRQLRQQQRRSLHDVEEDSRGELKASVLGAYERGERAVSIDRLVRLAEFYRVPVSELLPPRPYAPHPDVGEVVIDLAALEERGIEAVRRYVGSIQARRGDYNGRVLTVRRSDLETLAAFLDATPQALRRQLSKEGIVR